MCRSFHSLALVAAVCGSARGEYISDIMGSASDDKRALEIKDVKFWQGLLQSAERLQVEEHVQLAADGEEVLANLPAANEYVREALKEALEHVHSASDALLKEAARSAQLSVDQLDKPAEGSTWSFSSFVSEGSFRGLLPFSQAIKRFVGGGTYSQKLLSHISSRQADILPALQGVGSVTGSVLADCRTASKRSFDVLKYDLYNKGVPKTPESAKALANRIIEVSGKMRSRFTAHIREMVGNIVSDLEGKHDSAAATVVRDSVDHGASRIRLNLESRDQIMNV